MKQNFISKLLEASFEDALHFILFLIALPISWFYKKKRKHLWLICENQKEARDNAYWLFKYIRENEPHQDVVYAISKKSEDYDKVASLGDTVSYGTLKHWIYYLTAEKNISTQKGGKPNAAVCYFLEVYGIRKNTRVFLQHGITKDDVEFLHYKHSKISLFVCGAEREYKYVKERFGYPEGAVQLLGFCRFDNLHNAKVNPKQILIMPTWRSWISPPSNNEVKQSDIEKMKQSDYYKAWSAFIKNEELRKMLHDEDLTLIFYQHREMQKFTNLFSSDDDRIVIANDKEHDVQQLLMESAYLVTDYSSIAMDFAYMKKPLMYYQFDYPRYRQEHYGEGYFVYERDGFGPVCYELEDVIKTLKEAVASGFENDAVYLARHKGFFELCDTDNCKRNYEAIKELEVL
ncbi:MAG: CDP-glycerol glycerophosphotransferase family protein [bacterium]|nr:CDP-glycerol glycerophosphotransferase family protein [bacterium]